MAGVGGPTCRARSAGGSGVTVLVVPALEVDAEMGGEMEVEMVGQMRVAVAEKPSQEAGPSEQRCGDAGGARLRENGKRPACVSPLVERCGRGGDDAPQAARRTEKAADWLT